MLTAEPLIIARLKAELPVTVPPTRVTSSAAVAGTLDIAKYCPLVLVHPGGSASIDNRYDDSIVEVQIWRVVLVVKNIPDATFAATYAAAGALLRAIALALDGYKLSADFDALKFAARSEPEVGGQNLGVSEFELEFQTKFTLSTVPATPTTDSFITFDEKYDLDTAQAGDPVAEDKITLPQ